MDVVAVPLLQIIAAAIDIYIWVLIINVALSWLVQFNVINMSNRLVYLIADFTYRMTEPALSRIRRFMPNLGGLDISPVILILLLYFLQGMVVRLAYKLA